MHEWFGLLFATAVLLFLNGLYVAAEFAVISLKPEKLTHLAEQGKSWARRYLATISNTARQDWYIAVAQVGITLASLGLGMYGEHELAARLQPFLPAAAAHTLAAGLALAVLTFLHIVVGEMIPKSLALLYPGATARLVWWPMRLSGMILAPLCWVLNSIGNLMLRFFGLPVSQEMALVYSPEELRMAFQESHEVGLLEGERQQILDRIIKLGDTPIRRVMTPRTQLVAWESTLTVAEAAALVRQEQYSRYPVYRGSLDRIISVLHVKDLFRAQLRGEGETGVARLGRAPLFLPETLSCEEALARMRSTQVHLAVVLEESGGTAGVLTLEDLAEQLFGELKDEYDREEWGPVQAEQDGWKVSGTALLSEVSQATEVELEHSAETVNGLLLTLLGRPPRPKDEVDYQGLRFRVESVDRRSAAVCHVTLSREAAA